MNRERIRTIAVMLVSGALAVGGCTPRQTAAPAGPPSQTPATDRRPAVTVSPEARQALTDPANLDAALDAIEQAYNTMPRAAFDVGAKASEIGRDVNALLAFARDQIRLEIYGGVLRGPRGTLMAGAGNSVDKSLLLGALLTRHGFDVRYARGRLSEERAGQLVAQMFAAAKVQPPKPQGPSSPLELKLADLRKLTVVEWLYNVELVRAAIVRAGVEIPSAVPVTRDTLVREAVDHVWVEVQDGSVWVPLDPSFPNAKPGDAMTSADETWTEIPAPLHHRVTIRAVAEERADHSVSTRTVLEHTATAEELNGELVIFRHRLETPSGWTAAPMLQIAERTITGQVVAGGGLAGGVQRLGERLFGRRGQPPAPVSRGELTAEWLEVDFISPSGRAETVRREIFDRIGPAARARHQEGEASLVPVSPSQGIPSPFGTMLALSFRAGRLHPGLPLSRLESQLQHLRRAQEVVIRQQRASGVPSEAEAVKVAEATAVLAPELLATLAVSFYMRSQRSQAIARPPGVLFYESSPRLVIAGIVPGLGSDGKAVSQLSLDLRRNELRTVGDVDVPPRRIIWAGVLRGVLDGVLEHDVIRDALASAQGQATALSTVAIMAQARERNVPVIAVADPGRIEVLPVSEDVKATMQTGLRPGVLDIVPTQPVGISGNQRLGWWQVTLKTGDALAVLDNGLHFTVGELLLSVTIIVALAQASIPLYYALIQVIHWNIEELPGCLGVAPSCRFFGPPPPGCYYEDTAEGIHVRCD